MNDDPGARLIALHRADVEGLPHLRQALGLWRQGRFPRPARWPAHGSPEWRLGDLQRWRLHLDGRSHALEETLDGEPVL